MSERVNRYVRKCTQRLSVLSQLTVLERSDSGFHGVKHGTDIAGIPDSTVSMPDGVIVSTLLLKVCVGRLLLQVRSFKCQ